MCVAAPLPALPCCPGARFVSVFLPHRCVHMIESSRVSVAAARMPVCTFQGATSGEYVCMGWYVCMYVWQGSGALLTNQRVAMVRLL